MRGIEVTVLSVQLDNFSPSVFCSVVLFSVQSYCFLFCVQSYCLLLSHTIFSSFLLFSVLSYCCLFSHTVWPVSRSAGDLETLHTVWTHRDHIWHRQSLTRPFFLSFTFSIGIYCSFSGLFSLPDEIVSSPLLLHLVNQFSIMFIPSFSQSTDYFIE